MDARSVAALFVLLISSTHSTSCSRATSTQCASDDACPSNASCFLFNCRCADDLCVNPSNLCVAPGDSSLLPAPLPPAIHLLPHSKSPDPTHATYRRDACSTDTGGTCTPGSWGCSWSRNAVCESSKCVCSSGKCAVNGACVATAAPTLEPGGTGAPITPAPTTAAPTTAAPTAAPVGTAAPLTPVPTTKAPTVEPTSSYCRDLNVTGADGKIVPW